MTRLLAVAAALALTAGAASAATVSFSATPTANPGSQPKPVAFTGEFHQTLVGSEVNHYLSPWDQSVSVLDNGFSYSSVDGGASATYAFAPGTTELAFVWGSPDDYNKLTFNFADNTTATYSFNDLGGLNGYSPDTALATISTGVLAFNSVTFASGSNAFEYVIQTATVPVPAAGLLLLGALGALGLRRRKAS